ncbi:MAG: hypothetical protein HW418_2320 [Anaerolineales bacterium]|nr:hypothetical protein [Anaerolineales bacterium]
MPLVTGPFAQILEANRSRFNARFAEARRIQPRLDPLIFAECLRSTVAQVVEAVHHVRPEKAAEAAEVLYDLSLDLLGQEFLGPNSRYPFIVEGWRFLLPRLSRFIAGSPREFVGSTTNALYNLSTTPGARPGEWAASLLKLVEVCPDAPTLLRAGQVAAWRAGMAHYRLSALDLCRDLPPPVALTALGLSPQAEHPPLDTLIDSLKANPWLSPASNLQSPTPLRLAPGAIVSNYQLQIVSRVGAFRGFGGLFLEPPLVWPADDDFVVSDGEGTWLLMADVFGATFHRADIKAPSLKTSSPFTINKAGSVSFGKTSRAFPELANANSSAGNNTTLAVTTPFSHAVYLIALVGMP